MRFRAALVLALGSLGVLPSLQCDENLKPPALVTTTQRLDLAPGGTIHVNGSEGDLYVEAWDQPQVELTVTKFMPFEYAPGHPERATEHLEAMRVVAERHSPGEVDISMKLPARRGVLWYPTFGARTHQVTVEYMIHVPRAAKLVIHHGVGTVSVSGVTGDIQATCHRGDIVLWLPESGMYAIDAKNKFGKVSSDFAGDSHNQILIGQKFVSPTPATAQHLYLRMGFGGITLKPILPESEGKNPPPSGAK
jgi:hypothetical protein